MHPLTRQGGFSYLLLLFAVAALGIASAGSALMWSTLAQTERERELLFIGGEFSRALGRYYAASPVEPKRYPATLNDLVEDRRQPTPLRHLRKIYFDPVTHSQDWGLVMSDGQIRAVYSKSEKPARIRVLPAWVDATGDKVAGALKTGPMLPTKVEEPSRTGQSPDLRHADWLFVPIAPAGDPNRVQDSEAPVETTVPSELGTPVTPLPIQ